MLFSTASVNSNDNSASLRNMAGGTIVPQNVPGYNYYTESGFTGVGNPANYNGSGIGEASHGDWLIVQMTNVPPGLAITAPGSVTAGNLKLWRVDVMPGWQFKPSFYSAPPAAKVILDTTGSNPPSSANVVYEVVADDPNSVESFDIPFTATSASGASAKSVATTIEFGPTPSLPYPTSAPQSWSYPSSTLDLPRFIDTQTVVTVPTLTSGLGIAGFYAVGQVLTASFIITNPGISDVTFEQLLATTGVVSFDPASNLTLGPGQSYSYQSALLFSQPGSYHFYVTYETSDGVWTTSVATASGVSNRADVFIPNPYTLTLTLSGSPSNGGTVSANLQPGWAAMRAAAMFASPPPRPRAGCSAPGPGTCPIPPTASPWKAPSRLRRTSFRSARMSCLRCRAHRRERAP